MACLISAPDANGKGCVSFTTPERDHIINKDPHVREAVQSLKSDYLIGLHHNWHDHNFSYDPLFDFSLAGEGDLIERNGLKFPLIELDACNFAPSGFARQPSAAPFWDVLCTSRAVFFKGLPEFFQAIRTIYDRGRLIRVLHLCPVPPANKEGTNLHDIRERFERLFSSPERRYFTLMTMEWDNPFPLDLETLAFFYRSSRTYVHAAPQERRARAAAYAWACKIPMVSRENVASILPAPLRRQPFWYEFDKPEEMADAILAAMDADKEHPDWDAVAAEFSTEASGHRLGTALSQLAQGMGVRTAQTPINSLGFDIRLGRHHSIGGGTNQVDQTLTEFCRLLRELPTARIESIANEKDPELALAHLGEPYLGNLQPDASVSDSMLYVLKSNLKRFLPLGGQR